MAASWRREVRQAFCRGRVRRRWKRRFLRCSAAAKGSRRRTMRRVFTVLDKELRDTFRDRRTLLLTLLTSIAAGPVFLALILNMAANQAEKARDLELPVIGAVHAPALIAFLEREQVTIQAAPDDYEARIRAGDLDVVLVIDPKFEND